MSINPSSLKNLNPYAASKGGKKPIRLSLLPDTIAWLKRGGNASQRVEDLVEAALAKQLTYNSDYSHEQIDELKTKIESLTQELEECKSNYSHKQTLTDEQIEREIKRVFRVGQQSPTFKKALQLVRLVKQ